MPIGPLSAFLRYLFSLLNKIILVSLLHIWLKKHLDYEVDSGDEWEDEPEGESLSGSSDVEDEDEPATVPGDEDEDDDGFFVPHGHLSDDEVDEEERGVSHHFLFYFNHTLF